MNRYFKALIILVVLPVVVVLPMFLAQTLTIDAQVVAQQDTLQQRVEQYKAKLQTQPTKSDLTKLKLRCDVAQSKLKAISEKAGKVQERRVASYDKINKKLENLTTALKAKNITTTDLEAQSKELKTKTDTFATDLQAFKQATEDASNADCANDPLAMKASLESARISYTKLIQEVSDIRAYINNVIKTTLKQTKDDLQTQQKASSAAENSQTPTSGGATNATQ
ncbi:MAG: hypothetical protein H6793_02120 [Candidatus Nomurabacteria bacterium]|nr:MAG: hypothetical protein H6793_02120 [Candidatus Nomurabacteria bacterium]